MDDGTLFVTILISCIVCGIIGAALLDTSKKAGLGFTLGLLLGPLGVIVAAVMRDPSANVVVVDVSDQRKCPHCAEWIKREAIKCRFCQSELEPLPPIAKLPQLVCARCGSWYNADKTGCGTCGMAKPKNATVGAG